MDKGVAEGEAAFRSQSMPGVSTLSATSILAETGIDMSRFPTAGHFVAWAATKQKDSYEHAQHPDLGATHFDHKTTDNKANRLVAQLNKRRSRVTLQHMEIAA